LQIGQDQLVLAGKLTIERHFADMGARNDQVYADGVRTVGIEKLVRGVQDAFSWRQ